MKLEKLGNESFKDYGICEVWASARKGTKAPITFWLRHKKRWVTPYEQRLHGIEIPLLLGLTYIHKRAYKGKSVAKLLHMENPLLNDVPTTGTIVQASLPPEYWTRKNV